MHIEECATEQFERICRSDNIPIDMTVPGEPLEIQEYIESWRMKLWDQAYTGVFKGAEAFKKADSFKDARGAMLAVKRVIFKYIHLIYLPPYCTPCSVKRVQAFN